MSGGQLGPAGPAGGYPPPPQPPPGTGESWWERNRTWLLVGLGVVAVLLATVALMVALTGDDGGDAAADEVFVQPVGSSGPDPFTASMAKATTGALSAEVTGSRTGSEPGLYGGTRDESSCDRRMLLDFLLANPDKAAAFAQTQNITVAGIEDFLAGLTPIVLRGDTRVTNHGFRDGVATPFQAVLQAGTAVLVDATGVPRVRCACGNPLLPPVQARAPQWVGDPWPGWNPDLIQVVFVDVEVDVFVLIDVVTGEEFERPAGTAGGRDTDVGPEPEPTVPTTPEPVPVPEPAPAPEPAPVPEPEGPDLVLDCGGFEGIIRITASGGVDCDTATAVAVNVVSTGGSAGWSCSELGPGELDSRAIQCVRGDGIVYFEAFFDTPLL